MPRLQKAADGGSADLELAGDLAVTQNGSV